MTRSAKVSVPSAFFLMRRDLACERLDLQRVLDRDLEPLGRRRLDDEVDGAGAHGDDGGLDRAVRGLHDDGRDAGLAAELVENGHAVEAGHDEVEKHEGDVAALGALEDLQGLLAALAVLVRSRGA